MNAADAVAAVFAIGLTFYVWFGIADFGAGIWDMAAGNKAQGRRPRSLIDDAISPVWEANHVWLVFMIVVAWTAFGLAFASVFTTLFIPLALAILGIVLRGAYFALRKDAERAGHRHTASWLFGLGSLITPFFLGAALGGIFTGRVPPGNARGDEVTSWLNPTSFMIGLLAIAVGAFLSASYLVSEAALRDKLDMQPYFRQRALGAGVVVIGLAVAALIVLHADALRMYDRFTSRGMILLILAGVAIVAALILAARGMVRGLREAAAAAAGLAVWSWAVTQYPYLLPFRMTIANGSAPSVTMQWILVWFLIALVTAVPALVFLFILDQRGDLLEEHLDAFGMPQAGAQRGRGQTGTA